ncbi:amino acid-binding protein [Nocardioides sp. LHG3406-4]|uniref:amino acid-binding protein n=1 Tax=Nocardioides sp. LHG3406-4 TaxID=2804575 RepID=UPI003CF67E6A
MAFLLRVELLDVPGSLGRVATAIGEAGGDIEAIEIVEKTSDGTAIDDIMLELVPGVMPDSIVSACNTIDSVQVLWISRYAAGTNLFLDLEVVEALTVDPASALDRLVDLMPVTFRVDWGARVRRTDHGCEIVRATEAAPERLDWPALNGASRLESNDDNLLLCAASLGSEALVLGRHGGPEFLDSELARLDHLAGLALDITDRAQVQDRPG